MKLVLFGPPGGGKGTFAGQIKKILPKIPHISTGDIFRENLRGKTELGLKAKKYMDAGELVPDDVVIEMINNRLNQNDVIKHGFLLDGFPRTLDQAKALDEITNIDAFLLLEVSRDIIMKRLLGRISCPNCNAIFNIYTLPPKVEGICDKCGAELKHRSDDTEETVNNRLDVYEKNAAPIIEHYNNKNLLKIIDSTDTLGMSKKEIKKAIGYKK
jgi:adenylate kinase